MATSVGRLVIMGLGVLGLATNVLAQSPAAVAPAMPPPGLTLDQAMQYALEHYPTVRATLEQINMSAASVDVARSAFLPRLDSVWQSNRATANNIVGQLLPQGVLPSISGPVLASASSDSVWGSAAGALFSWELFDFGLRHAGVTSAEATLSRARASNALTRLEVQRAVADAFLTVVAGQRALAAARADVDRREVLRRSVQTLVDNQLRPGAEASRANAEHAAAQTRFIQTQQAVTIAESTLLRVLGITSGTVTIAGDSVTARVPDGEVRPGAATSHPLTQVHQAAIEQSRAAEDLLAHTDLPHVYVQSSVLARGSGARPDGAFDGGRDGLGLDRANWAAGVQVVLPNLFDFSSLRARRTAAAAATRSEMALYDEAVLTVTSEQRAALAMLQAARAVAAATPVQLAAAQQSEAQARARYNAGLAPITEVADAQSLLAQAETQDQLARVDVWRAWLAVAVAENDVGTFVNMVRRP